MVTDTAAGSVPKATRAKAKVNAKTSEKTTTPKDRGNARKKEKGNAGQGFYDTNWTGEGWYEDAWSGHGGNKGADGWSAEGQGSVGGPAPQADQKEPEPGPSFERLERGRSRQETGNEGLDAA